MNSPIKLTFVSTILLSLGLIILHQSRLIECTSGSLQGISYVVVLKGALLKRGDLVAIAGHQVKTTPETSFLKRILGLPGDVMTHDRDGLSVGPYHLPLLKQTKDGKPLNPQPTKRVPTGHAFVGGDHSRSFDSRYEEFGFVPFPKIWGKGILAW